MNLNQNFAICFLLKKAKVNAKGLAPIWVRVTIDGKRTECSTKRQTTAAQWNEKTNSPRDEELSKYMQAVAVEIRRHYNVLLMSKDYVTVEDVKRSFMGIKEQKRTFLDVFKQYIQHLKERSEVEDLSEMRVGKFEMVLRKCQLFIKIHLKKNDVLLEDIKLNFVHEFQHFIRTAHGVGHNAAMKYVKDLRQVMKYAVMLEYIPSNPFDHFKCSFKKAKRRYLDKDELAAIQEKEFKIRRLEEVRDCYLFSCYTGYAYCDLADLSPDDVKLGMDGNKWIIRDRIKSDVTENVPLLPIASQLIEKYKNHPLCIANNRLLPVYSNQRYNAYLKEIAGICGIEKNLTTHTARHTFATTVCLSNNVPMETVMELLGHTDIRTTQIYGKIVRAKLSDDMNTLRSRLGHVTMQVNRPEEKRSSI